MQSSNPVFKREEAFSRGGYAGFREPDSSTATLEQMYAQPAVVPTDTRPMTYDDVVTRTGITFGVLLVGAVIGWIVPQLLIIGLIGGLVLGLVNSFKREPSPFLILAYAALEGIFVGAVSMYFENLRIGTTDLTGIVPQAIVATLCVFGATLLVYRTGKIRVTPKFRKVVLIALLGYLAFSVFNLVAMWLGWGGGAFGFRSGLLGIAIGVFAVCLAALCLVLDFDFIEQGVRNRIPERYSWTAAFGLTVTLVWLYLEMLRLLAILRGE